MSEKLQFVDFGAPDKFGAHLFRVEIPAARTEVVRIVEDFGNLGLEGGIPRDEDRAILIRSPTQFAHVCVFSPWKLGDRNGLDGEINGEAVQ